MILGTRLDRPAKTLVLIPSRVYPMTEVAEAVRFG
jgi:hypothetical protein